MVSFVTQSSSAVIYNMVQICPFCENGVEITQIKSYPDYEQRFFSCGHMAKPIEINTAALNEPTTNVSATAALVLSRLKQSKKVKIKEKILDGKPCLHFSAEYIRFTINNEILTIQLLESKFSENISADNILKQIQSVIQEVKINSATKDKEREKILSLLEKLNDILVAQPKKSFFQKKWVFSLATPFILKIIEIVVTGKKISKTPV
jgi:hypothetical protein